MGENAGVDSRSLCLSSVFHEIEGRLATISIFSEQLARDAGTVEADDLRRRLVRIHCLTVETQRIIDAIKRLDDVSAPERSHVDVSDLCSKIVRAQSTGAPHGERLQAWIEPGICVKGDPDQVNVLLENLIGNALKFASSRESPQLRITTSREGTRLVVHVRDNGVGLAPEDEERIFQPFTRCHPHVPGTGIGLTIARRIVERHGGRIWATGNPGIGTTISFCL
jgi:signal transduction histidine kinase